MNEHTTDIIIPSPLLDALVAQCETAGTTPAKLLAGFTVVVMTSTDDTLGRTLAAAPEVVAAAYGFADPIEDWARLEVDQAVGAILDRMCDDRGATIERLIFGLYEAIANGGSPATIQTVARLADSAPLLGVDGLAALVEKARG